MHVVIHANNVPWQVEYLDRFIKGFEKHGMTVGTVPNDVAIPDAINVVFANNSWKKTVATCSLTGIPLLTVNRCFFGSRHDMVAIGWKGFNGDADFSLQPFMPDDRWLKHGFQMPEWQEEKDGYVLICGEFRDMSNWYRSLDKELQGMNVRFRPHPFTNKIPAAWERAPGKLQDDIETALEGARVCITYDSIAGCDAVLAGVPSVAYGRKSMARPVSCSSWKEYLAGKALPKRLPWASRLAYCQWDHEEIENGDFWTHLSSGKSYTPAAIRHSARP